MNNSKLKRIFTTVVGTIGLLVLIYFIVFAGALGQQENHLAIAMVLPRVILNSEPGRIDERTYIVPVNKEYSFIKLMQDQGFIYADHLGSGYFFKKDGKFYISASRRYSSYFSIFTYPKQN